jgi:hypothetical protein
MNEATALLPRYKHEAWRCYVSCVTIRNIQGRMDGPCRPNPDLSTYALRSNWQNGVVRHLFFMQPDIS